MYKKLTAMNQSGEIDFSSEVPSGMLRLNKGKIALGYDADFIVVNYNYDVGMTVINSKII